MGDFFRLHLSPDFVDPWDQWLRGSLFAARDSLGERWKICYMSAPIWRFTLPAGLVGPRAAQGILMPSVDRVGREFPLTLVRLFTGQIDVVLTDRSAVEWFPELEETALDTLSGDVTREALAAQLARLSWPAAQEGAASQVGLWSALLPEGLQTLSVRGMPDAMTFRNFLDPQGAWPSAIEPACGGRP